MFWEMLSGFIKGVGALTESNAAASAATYNKNIDIYNQSVTLTQGQIAEDQLRREQARRLGAIRANAGASGVDLSGSAMDVLYESSFNAEKDALNTRYSYQARAKGYGMDAQLQGAKAGYARQAGYLQASGILLDSYGKGYEQDYLNGGGTGSPFRLGA